MAEATDPIIEESRAELLPAPKPAPSLPFILTLTALLIYFAFQTLQLLSERSNLGLVKSSQDEAIQQAEQVQGQFKTLVSKTSELAEQGHAGAKMVMEELLNRGVSASPHAPAPDTKAPPAALPKLPAK
jgi:hypothetical protein